MLVSAHKEKRASPVARKARQAKQPIAPVQHAQRTEIHNILHSTGGQAKLTIGQSNDKYEQEADRVADEVMRMPDPQGHAGRSGSNQPPPPRIQRMCPECEEEEELQRQTEEEGQEELVQPMLTEGVIQRKKGEEEVYPQSLSRDGFVKEWRKHTGRNSEEAPFGYTRMDIGRKGGADEGESPYKTKQVAGGLVLKHAKMPRFDITSIYTQAGSYIEGEAPVGPGFDCPEGRYPVEWIITDDGASKIAEGEQEHCSDYKRALDISVRPYVHAINELADSKQVFSNLDEADAALESMVGVHPSRWEEVAKCLLAKTLVRDEKHLHTPIPDISSPAGPECGSINATVSQTSLRSVGQLLPDKLVRGCGEKQILQRQQIDENDKEIQAKEVPEQTPIVASNLESRINSLKGGGRPLDQATRAFFEPRIGHDFSHVRVHADSHASETAKSVNARAFTLGSNMVFGSGEYQPQSKEGKRLLGHELTHVVQQSGGSALCLASKKSANPSPNSSKLDIVFLGPQSGFDRVQRKPPIRQPNEVIAEAEAFPAEAVAELERRRLAEEVRTTDPEKSIELVLAKANAEAEVEKAVRMLIDTYRHALSVAGDDTKKQRQAQENFLDAVSRVRESYEKMFDMQVRWGIEFDYGTKLVYFSKQEGVSRYAVYAWSKNELDIIDSILQQIPSTYLSRGSQRIKKIQRGGSEGATGASWNETTGTITIYDEGFKDPEKVADIILHEVGHGTVTERSVVGVGKLPPEDWMKLSDWKATPRASVASELSLSATDATDLLAKMDERKGRQSNVFSSWFEVVNARKVVFNKYEGIGPCENLLHYATAHDAEFMSDYARTHPAEDLAESFSHYLLKPGDTKATLDVGKKGVTDKWDYLVAHYPEKLRKKP